MTTRKQVTDAVTADAKGFSKKNGTWTFRRGFFYRMGGSAQSFADRVSAQMTAAGIPHTVVDMGEHHAPFRGGASVKASSHWWVEVRVAE
jgi:hypothetical protein